MPYDSSGVYSLPTVYLAVTGQTVLASQHNTPLEDIAKALSSAVLRTGVGPMLANFNLNNFKVIGVADGTADNDAATFGQVKKKVDKWGSNFASSPTDTSVHLPLYGTTYGVSVTDGAQNYISAGAHNFYSGATLVFSVSAGGVAKAIGNLQAGDAVFGTDGNATGSIWSQWGSTSAFSAISSRIEARGYERARDFNSQTNAGEIGTMGLLRKVSAGNANPGDLVDGSVLQWSAASGTIAVAVGSGTWRCLGICTGGGADSSVTLFKRVS